MKSYTVIMLPDEPFKVEAKSADAAVKSVLRATGKGLSDVRGVVFWY
jgi:hypothetical protein